MKKFIVVIVAIMIMAVTLTGCKTSHYYTSEARDAKWEVKTEANNFKVMRRITVINTRTNELLLQFEGKFALTNNEDNELEMTIKNDDGSYKIDYIYLNENVAYVVEDITEATIADGNIHFVCNGFGGGER